MKQILFIAAPDSIAISANATDANGAVTKVELYIGSVKLGEDLTSPYSCSWTNVPAGTYGIKMASLILKI